MATQASKRKSTTSALPTSSPQFRVVGKDDAPAPPSGGLNFGALAKPSATKATSSHPTIALSSEGLELLGQYAEKAALFNPLNKLVGSKGSIKAQLRSHLTDAYFRLYAGRAIDDSRINTATADKTPVPVKLTFKEAYSKLCTDLATLLSACPKAKPHVAIVNTLKIEFDKIAIEKQQPFVDAIIAAAGELGIQEGISASQCVQPKPGFHQQRCVILTPEENIAFDEILPITAYPQL